MVVLDLHATVTQKMADNANALIAYKTYPHVDMYERMHQAAVLLARTFAGEDRAEGGRGPQADPLCARWRALDSPPVIELMAMASRIEASGEALEVSLFAGFSLGGCA